MFYNEAVRPILDKHFPDLVHSAGQLGKWGSDVLGFDTPQSTDHGWGPRLILFLSEPDYPKVKEGITKTLSRKLPYQFHGYSTHFTTASDGAPVMTKLTKGPIHHKVEVTTLRRFFNRTLKINPFEEITAKDWLTFSEQSLLEVTAGKVYHDGLNDLVPLRDKFSYYPPDIWRYMLAAQWRRICQEEPFVGRCGDVGDELGSKIIAARLVRDLMRLCFLMEKQYAPYPKWFGTAFTKLDCAKKLRPILESVLGASTWKGREQHLAQAYEFVAKMHNSLGITSSIEPKVRFFHNRPYLVIDGERFAQAIRATIETEEVRSLPAHIGSVDQFSDSTDIRSYPEHRVLLKALYHVG
jgi:hypothetical protein